MNSTTQIMELARRRYLADLPFAPAYRPGKFSGVGFPKEERATVCQVRGNGILKRLWTTHSGGDRIRIYLYIDGADEPVLHGSAQEIARAAQLISCAELPLGGFLDGHSVSLYLPYRFEQGFRLEAEPTGDVGDGPYWQVDYALDTDEECGRVEQWSDGERLCLRYHPADGAAANDAGSADPPLELLAEEVELAGCSPKGVCVDGPGIVRRISLSGEALDKLWLRMAFDVEPDGEGQPRGTFQVDAPLRCLVGPFSNAGVERLGGQMEIHFPMPFRSRMDLQLLAMLDEGEFGERYRVKLKVLYERDPARLDEMRYFNAAFSTGVTNGVDDFEVCSTAGEGHFVGVHLFDTGHDHGGGDNILFDAGLDSAGQLHGVCAEDYFHHAYMRTGVLAPYAGCPSHSARYRHHLEMPIPFEHSFVFNWGEFAGQAPRAVGFWYQREVWGRDEVRELTYRASGPFALEQLDELKPGRQLPQTACPWPGQEAAVRQWRKRAQRGFVDLCHVHRRHIWSVPPSTGWIASGICTYLETAVWAQRRAEVELVVGCDDAIRVFLGDELVLADAGRQDFDPFRVSRVRGELRAGLNRIGVAVANTDSSNWLWNGFSLVIDNALGEDELLHLS